MIVTIDSVLRFDSTPLSEELIATIAQELWMFNPSDPDEQIALARRDGRTGELVLPRGYALRLREILAHNGIEIEWIDRRVKVGAEIPMPTDFVEPRSYQQRAVERMTGSEQGIYEAATACVAGDTILSFNRAGKGFKRDIADAYKRFNDLKGGKSWDRSIPTYCRSLVDGVFRQHLVEGIVYAGKKQTIVIELSSGKKIQCTKDHGILTSVGWLPAGFLSEGASVTVNGTLTCRTCGSDKDVTQSPNKYQPAKYPGLCRSCIGVKTGRRGPANPQYKGRYQDSRGYWYVRADDHPRANRHKCVFEHILVAEKMIGRYIKQDEHVHHKNGLTWDNKPENLQVLTPSEHNVIHKRMINMDGGTAGTGGEIIFLPKQESIVSITDGGVVDTYDMMMQDPHNNFVANGVVVHNSGKTISAALVCSRLQQRTIIVVDKINLATQWRERFEQALGVTPTIIGDGSWDESDITIATRQSLWTRREELDGPDFGWWANWGMLIVDECHAISAPSVRELFQRFPAHYRFGITATPDRHNWIMAASRGIIGEIVCRTTEEELQEAGVLLKPRVVVYRTPFQYRSNPGMSANMAWVNLTKALKTDTSRNMMIGMIMAQDLGQTMLVQTDHTSHAQVLMSLAQDAGWPDDRILLLTGKQNSAERDRIRLMAEEGNVLIVSTIGKEALDIPRLNRYMIAFPTRNQTATKQMLGRVKRVHDTKNNVPVVYDIFDHRVPRLINMFKERRSVYEKEKLQIEFTGDAPLISPHQARS